MDKYQNPEFIALVEIPRLANTLQTVMDMGMNDITSRQWLLLMILGKCKQPPNLNQLAELCGITRQSAKQLVDKLTEKGFVTTQKDDNDKRNISIAITEKGRSWGVDNLELNERFVKKLYDGITQDELQVFAEVQQKLLKKLAEIKEQSI